MSVGGVDFGKDLSKAMLEEDEVWRALYEEAPEPSPPPWRIEGTWLCEVVNECTCGAGGLGYGHERGCGMEPLVDLSKVPGWDQLKEQIRRG